MTEIQSLARGLRVVDMLAEAEDGLSITEIAKRLGVNKSSASRIVQTLVAQQWAETHPKNRRYCLGAKFSLIHSLHADYDTLQQLAHPFLHYLVRETGECAHIAVHLKGMVYVLDDVETDTILRVASGINRTTYLHCTAVGKALLAFAPIAAPEHLPQFTEKTISDKLALQHHLKMTRKQGFAVDDEEMALGVRCIAAPVFNHSNQCIASIGVSGPSVRVRPERTDEMGMIVRNTGLQLSHILGYEDALTKVVG